MGKIVTIPNKIIEQLEDSLYEAKIDFKLAYKGETPTTTDYTIINDSELPRAEKIISELLKK